MNKKAAIELSANFIIIIIISIVILGAGFVLVKKLIGGAADQLRDVDNQMQDRLQLMMTNNNERIAIYPTSFELARGKSQLVAIGIMNDGETANFKTDGSNVKPFNIDGTPFTGTTSCPLNKCISFITNDGTIAFSIPSKDKVFKNALVKVDKSAPNGEYVITVNVVNTATATPAYAVSKIYVIVK